MKDLRWGGSMYVLLVYDVKVTKEKGAKRLTKIFKICKKYLNHIQNSVFEGEISASKLNELEYELKSQINEDYDSIIVFKSRDKKWLGKSFWGKEEDLTSNFL